MNKTLRTYGLHKKQGDWYCNLCKIEIKKGKKINGLYCPRCGMIFPYYEEYK